MSTLWKMIVMEQKDDYVDLLVKLDHPDAGAFPDDKNFALQLLLQEAYSFDKNFERFPNGSLGNAISHNLYLPNDLEELVDTYVKDVIIYEAQNLPWKESEAHAKMDDLCKKDGLEKDNDDWDDAWSTHWSAFWKDYARIPWAIYRITTTDAKWTDHLKKYQEFYSAAFSEGRDFVNQNIKIDVPNASTISDYVVLKKAESSPTKSSFSTEENTKQSGFKKLLNTFREAFTNANNNN